MHGGRNVINNTNILNGDEEDGHCDNSEKTNTDLCEEELESVEGPGDLSFPVHLSFLVPRYVQKVTHSSRPQGS